MKKHLLEKIEIPEGVEVFLNENSVKVKGSEGESQRDFNAGKSELRLEEKNIVLENKAGSKTDKRTINTIKAHLNNMIQGVQKKFEYKLKICFGHFPFTVKQEGNKFIIKNFLGEKINREVIIPSGADVEIQKEIITVKSVNKEVAGQASANFEAATKIKGRDKRIFQDGIYIINKNGKEM